MNFSINCLKELGCWKLHNWSSLKKPIFCTQYDFSFSFTQLALPVCFGKNNHVCVSIFHKCIPFHIFRFRFSSAHRFFIRFGNPLGIVEDVSTSSKSIYNVGECCMYRLPSLHLPPFAGTHFSETEFSWFFVSLFCCCPRPCPTPPPGGGTAFSCPVGGYAKWGVSGNSKNGDLVTS